MAVVRSYAIGDLLGVVRAGAAWSFAADGTLVEAAPNALRQDYDPATLLYRGVPVEPAGANDLRNPRAAGAGSGTIAPGGGAPPMPTHWAYAFRGSGLSVSTAPVTAFGMAGLRVRLFGTTSASPGGEVVEFEQRNAVPAVIGAAETGSFLYRLAAGTVPPGVSLNCRMLSLTAGGTIVDNVAAVLAAPDAALRLAAGTVTPSAGVGVGGFVVVGLNMTGWPALAAVDVTIDLFAPQLEPLTFATSRILPPVGTPAASSRAADDLTMADIDRWFSAAEGTFVLDFTPGQASSAVPRGVLAVDDGTTANAFDIRMLAPDNRVRLSVTSGGATTVLLLDTAAAPTLARNTLRFSYGPAGYLMSLNGAAPVSASGAMPTGLRFARPGRRPGTTGNHLSGWIGPRLDYFPRQYTDAAAEDGFTIRTR